MLQIVVIISSSNSSGSNSSSSSSSSSKVVVVVFYYFLYFLSTDFTLNLSDITSKFRTVTIFIIESLKLSTTPCRRVGEQRYSATHS
jgi:hypothetical protein